MNGFGPLAIQSGYCRPKIELQTFHITRHSGATWLVDQWQPIGVDGEQGRDAADEVSQCALRMKSQLGN
jgi:hypothetical protein